MKDKNQYVSMINFLAAEEAAEEAKRAHMARAEAAAACHVLKDAAKWIVENAIDACDNRVASVEVAMNVATDFIKGAAWFNRDVADPRAALAHAVETVVKNDSPKAWWTARGLEAAGLLHLWAPCPQFYTKNDSKPNYFRLMGWIYNLSEILNNLAKRRKWGTRFNRDGNITTVTTDPYDEIGPDLYVWQQNSHTVYYRSSTGNTIAKFSYWSYGQWRTEVWHREGPVARHLVLNQLEAEAFSWKF